MNLRSDPRFDRLLQEIKQLHDMKNNDYARTDDPLSNFRMSEEFGVPAWKGCLVRVSDKTSRIFELAKKGEASVKEESIVDTLKDLAVYALICIELFEQEKCKDCDIGDPETCNVCLTGEKQ